MVVESASLKVLIEGVSILKNILYVDSYKDVYSLVEKSMVATLRTKSTSIAFSEGFGILAMIICASVPAATVSKFFN